MPYGIDGGGGCDGDRGFTGDPGIPGVILGSEAVGEAVSYPPP